MYAEHWRLLEAKRVWCIGLTAVLLTGCSHIAPLKGGRGGAKMPAAPSLVPTAVPASQATYEISQGDNPAQPSVQIVEESTEQEETPIVSDSVPYPHIPAPVARKTTVKRQVETRLGSAQKDVSREISARLAGIRPIQYIGAALILAALAMFHPAVKAITMSATLQAATGACGLVLIVLPLIVANNPTLFAWATILGIALPALWFFAHRHGRLQGFVDANKDGIDDRLQRRRSTPGNNPFADPNKYDVR